jgi:protein phosphatase PTC7
MVNLSGVQIKSVSSTKEAVSAPLHFQGASFVIPHPAKAHKGGEDTNFVNPLILAVFDGVSGWASSGIDPALYPKALEKGVQEYVKTAKDDRSEGFSMRILKYAAEFARTQTGSSTACILTINRHNRLDTANLGDSGFLVIRDRAIYRRSEEQQHSFNMPFQIGTHGDSPGSAKCEQIATKEGDLIVVASDGLLDNVWDADILRIVNNNEALVSSGQHKQLAQLIAQEASQNANNSTYFSPFANNAGRHGYRFDGGKPDDITVVVASVKAFSPQV